MGGPGSGPRPGKSRGNKPHVKNMKKGTEKQVGSKNWHLKTMLDRDHAKGKNLDMYYKNGKVHFK
jgi:hypothetical protein